MNRSILSERDYLFAQRSIREFYLPNQVGGAYKSRLVQAVEADQVAPLLRERGLELRQDELTGGEIRANDPT